MFIVNTSGEASRSVMWHVTNSRGDHFLTPEYHLAEACVKLWLDEGCSVGIHYYV